MCGCTCRMCVCISFLKLEYQLGDAIELALRYCVRCACNTWMATIRLICRAHTAAAAQQVYRLLFGTHTARAHHRACRESHGHIQSAARGCDQIFMGDPPQQITRRERMHTYYTPRSNFMPIMRERRPAASSACKSAATNVKCETHLLPSRALFLCDQHNSRRAG